MNRHIRYWFGWIAGLGLLSALFLPTSLGSAADGEAWINVYPTSGLVTDENGGTAAFFMVLGSRPAQPVEIPLSSSNPGEGVPVAAIVKFTPGTWNTPQQVVIQGVADHLQDGNIPYTILIGPARSKDSRYNGLDAQDVTLVNLNDSLPNARDDQAQTQEDVSVKINVLENDTDLVDQPVAIVIETPPQQGSAAVEASEAIAYTPTANFYGEDRFRYAVCDSDGDCSPANVLVTVTPVDDPVNAKDDKAVTSLNTPVVIDVLANDSAGGGSKVELTTFEPLSAKGGVVTRVDNGTLLDLTDDKLNYQPPVGYTGKDQFKYTASNGEKQADAIVKIDIKPGVGAPVAGNDSFATGQKTVLTIPAPGVLGNDSDPNGDPLQTTLVDAPDHGSLILNPNGSFTFTPNGTYVGIDKYVYTASDGKNQSNPATVSIDIKDQINPMVTWITPVKNGGIYDVDSGTVQLKVEASDNVGITRVRFYRWDAIAVKYVEIGQDPTAAYQIDIPVESLNPGWNQVFARSYDKAGNPSDQQFIWLFRTGNPIFLPLIIR